MLLWLTPILCLSLTLCLSLILVSLARVLVASLPLTRTPLLLKFSYLSVWVTPGCPLGVLARSFSRRLDLAVNG